VVPFPVHEPTLVVNGDVLVISVGNVGNVIISHETVRNDLGTRFNESEIV
jgi:hypothetical protein